MTLGRRPVLARCAALPFAPLVCPAAGSPVRRYPARAPEGDGGAPPPPNLRPYGFGCFTVAPGTPGAVISWSGATPRGAARLRLAVAADQRENKELAVALARSGRRLGVLDMRVSCPFETFDLELSARDATAAAKEGVRLMLVKGTTPLWLLRAGEPRFKAPGLLPQLYTAPGARPLDEFRARMDSLDSLAPLTWMGGCVLDGLRDLGLKRGLAQQLEYNFRRPGGEVPAVLFAGVESTLPIAVLAAELPEHPAVARALEHWKAREDAEGAVASGATSAEGCYTIGYPLAMIWRVRRRPDLRESALRQVRLRQRRLVVGEDIWLRWYRDGRRTYQNWSRGVAWYFLGITRTLAALGPGEDLEDLRAECRRVAAWAARRQRPDGLWSGFLHEPPVAPDTSGSSGIAAALALGVRHGWLPSAYLDVARKTARGVERFLTPDGFLTGVSQSNKREGGEELQRSDYRVALQFGMGLYGQILAALEGTVS